MSFKLFFMIGLMLSVQALAETAEYEKVKAGTSPDGVPIYKLYPKRAADRRIASNILITEEADTSGQRKGSKLFFAPTVFISGIKGRTPIATGALSSNINYGAELQWSRALNKTNELQAFIGTDYLSFAKPGTRTLQNADIFYYKFGVGLEHFWESFSLGLMFSARQKPLITAISASTLTLEKINFLQLSLNPKWVFYETRVQKWFLQGGATVSPSLTTKSDVVEAGVTEFSGKAGLELRQQQRVISADVFGRGSSFTTQNVKQTYLEFGAEVGFGFKLN